MLSSARDTAQYVADKDSEEICLIKLFIHMIGEKLDKQHGRTNQHWKELTGWENTCKYFLVL